MGKNTKEWLAEEIDFEQFQQELKSFTSWVSKRTRSRQSWYLAMVDWAEGRR